MSEPQTNVCNRCGGQRNVFFKVDASYSNNFTPHALAVSNSSIKLCMCPPEPKPKHDGALPASGELSSDAHVRWDGSFIAIQCRDTLVMLDREQARSLQGWLEQELGKGQEE